MGVVDGEGQAVIGVLGGMGPAATADFYAKLVAATPAERDQDHPRTLIWSDSTIPDRTAALLENGRHPGEKLTQGARLLQNAGADVIAVPCNTAHAFLRETQAAVTIPVLDMVQTTVDVIADEASADEQLSIGLLATNGTIQSGLYDRAAQQRDVTLLKPVGELQASVMAAIRLVKAGAHHQQAADMLCEAAADLARQGATAVIAGCTEIPVALRNVTQLPVRIIDPTVILAEASVRWARNYPTDGKGVL